MRFGNNIIGQIPPPKTAKMARRMLRDLPKLIDGAKVEGWETLSDEDVVRAASLVWAQLAQVPCIDEKPEALS